MTFLEELGQAMRHQRMLMKHRPDRVRFRLLIYAAWMLAFGIGFAVMAGLQRGDLGALSWWREQLPANLLVSACVMSCFFTVFRSFEKLAPQRWLDTIMGWRDWRSAVFFSTVSICCSLLGVVLGLLLVDVIWNVPNLRYVLGNLGFWRQFLIASTVISAFMVWRYRARLKQQLLQARVTEAQLRLLQGQIEPHFLFNTLANVQSLIDFDPERAKLRVALSLPAELAGVEVQPLLVQPLVENAIHHGLEPQIAGGTVSVTARRVDGRLWIEVSDDGQGLNAPRRRAGNGVALENIRSRLTARFGPSAQLELLPREGGGTLARIQFPLPSIAAAQP
jgi:hypothetical protein